MKQLVFRFSACFLLVGVVGVGCKKASNPNNETEHESINKLEMTFRQGATTAGVFVVEDADGDGGNPPSRIDTIRLSPSQTYTVETKIFTVSAGTTREITPTILAQGTSHEFFYLPTGVSLTIAKTDRDANNFPLGLQSNWTSGATATGSVLVKLMHKPLLKGPNDAPTVGHSDIEIALPVKIQ